MMMMVPMPVAYFREDWNRSNSSSLGSDWRTDSGTASAQVLSNGVEAITMSMNSGENGNWHTYVDLSTLRGNGGRFLTDNYKVRAQLKAPSINNGAAPPSDQDSSHITCINLAIPDSFSASTMEMYFGISTASSSGLVTQANAVSSPYAGAGQTGQTTRATTSGVTPTMTSLIELERRANASGISVFTAWVDGTVGCTFTDSSSVVPKGSSNRRWGFVVEGNYPFFQNQYNTPAIDWIEAFDLYK